MRLRVATHSVIIAASLEFAGVRPVHADTFSASIVADSGQTIGGVSYTGGGYAVIGENGTIAFGNYTGTSALFTAFGGNLALLAAAGQTIGGNTVTSIDTVGLTGPYVNGSGQVAYIATYANSQISINVGDTATVTKPNGQIVSALLGFANDGALLYGAGADLYAQNPPGGPSVASTDANYAAIDNSSDAVVQSDLNTIYNSSGVLIGPRFGLRGTACNGTLRSGRR